MCTARLPTLGHYGPGACASVLLPVSGSGSEDPGGSAGRIRHFSAPASGASVHTMTSCCSMENSSKCSAVSNLKKSELCLSLKKSNSWLRRSCLKLKNSSGKLGPGRSQEEGDIPRMTRILPPQESETEIMEKSESFGKISSNDCNRLTDFEPSAMPKVQSQTTCHHLPYNFFDQAKSENYHDQKSNSNSKCYGSKSNSKNTMKNNNNNFVPLLSVLSSSSAPTKKSLKQLNSNFSSEKLVKSTGSNFEFEADGNKKKSDITSINHSSLPLLSLQSSNSNNLNYFSLSHPEKQQAESNKENYNYMKNTTMNLRNENQQCNDNFSSNNNHVYQNSEDQLVPDLQSVSEESNIFGSPCFDPLKIEKELFCESTPPHRWPSQIRPADPGGGLAPSPNPSLLNAHQARRSPAPTGSSPTPPLPPLPLPTTKTTTMSTTSPSTSPSPNMTSPKYPSPKPNFSSAVKCCHRVSSTTTGKTLPGFNRKLLMFVFSFAMVISVLVGPADAKRCSSMDIKHNIERFKNLTGCSIIEGHLIISGFKDDQALTNLSFPELREVTEYVIFYQAQNIVKLNHLFPNLSVIRGNKLVADFALVIYQMERMVEIGLKGLTHILKGGVRIEKNRMLCFVNTISWESIVTEKYHQNIHIEENNDHFMCRGICPLELKCPHLGTSSNCWNEHSCQIDPQNLRVTVNHSLSEDKCNQQCIGGCNGTSHLNCFACRRVMDQLSDGRKNCIEQCPDGLLLYGNWRCISRHECKQKVSHFNDLTIDQERPYKIYEKKCLEQCPAGSEEIESNGALTCTKCRDCSKECTGTTIRSLEVLRTFEGCTKILGDLTIQISGKNVVDELQKNLGQVSVITGTLKISRSFPIISLDFFKSLTLVQGVSSPDSIKKVQYSLEILENENLQKLFPTDSKVKITTRNGADGDPQKGKAFIHYNQKLCRKEIERLFTHFNIEDPGEMSADISYGTNGHKSVCSEETLDLKVVNLPPDGLQLKFENYQKKIEENYQGVDTRALLNYEIHYRQIDEVTFKKENVTKYGGRDACGNDEWKIDDHSPTQPTQVAADFSTIWPDEGTIIRDGIKPFSYYAIFVTTLIVRQGIQGGQDIKSAASEIVYFQTPPSHPEAPEDLQVNSVNYSTVNITWTEPKRPNGIIKTYKIEVKHHKVNIDKVLTTMPYCDERFTIKNNESPKTKTDENEQMSLNGDPDTDSNANGQGTCDCTNCGIDGKNGKGKDNGGLSFKEKEKLEEFQFHNDLINSVYQRTIYPSSNGGGSDTKRKKRSLSSTDSNITNIVTEPKTKKSTPIMDYDSAPDKVIEAREIQMTTIVFNETVLGDKRQLTIKGLTHFSKYTVTIKACHQKPDGVDMESMYCSEIKSLDFRTEKKEGADDIVGKIISDQNENNGTDVWITIPEPAEPNLAIVYYNFKFKMQHAENSLKQCETAHDLIEKGRRHKLSTPGTYYVSVRAVSLAGPGAWSEELLVTVGEDGKMALLWSILIPILVIGIFGIVIGFYLYYRRQRPGGDETTMNPIYWKRNFEGIEIPRDLIERGRELGTGSFGTVYAGVYQHENGEMNCAIKEAKNSMLREQLLGEADLMRTIDTPHVVQLLGVVTEGFPQFVVLELMENGDLKKHLRTLRRSPPNQSDILLMAIQVADGMAYLSTVPNPKIIHRDLAARNCMVNEKVIVKIGDFGLARDLSYAQDYYRMNGKDWLPVRWMSPESLRDSVFSISSDVWAYGVVLWEMVTLAEQPYQGLSNDEVLNFVKNRRTMEIPRNCPEIIATLMQDCWAYEPEDRPSFVDICKRLQEFANDEFQRNSFITSALCTRILRRLEAPSGGDPADDLPIDEAERTPLQANGGSNGNGESLDKATKMLKSHVQDNGSANMISNARMIDNGHAVIPVPEAINLRDFNGDPNADPIESPRQHNMWERIRKILRNRYRPAGQSLPTTATTPTGGTGNSEDRSSNPNHHQTPTTVEA